MQPFFVTYQIHLFLVIQNHVIVMAIRFFSREGGHSTSGQSNPLPLEGERARLSSTCAVVPLPSKQNCIAMIENLGDVRASPNHSPKNPWQLYMTPLATTHGRKLKSPKAVTHEPIFPRQLRTLTKTVTNNYEAVTHTVFVTVCKWRYKSVTAAGTEVIGP